MVPTSTFRPNLAGFTPTKIHLPSCNHDHDEDGNNNNDCYYDSNNEHVSNNNNNGDFVTVRVNATNDFFATSNNEQLVSASSHQHQHWIDLHFLETSLGQEETNRLLSQQLNAPPCQTLLGTFSGRGGHGGEQVLGTLSMPLHISCKFYQHVTLMDPTVAAGTVVLDVGCSSARKRQQERLMIQKQVQESIRTFSSTDTVDNDDASHLERQLELLAQKQQQQPLRLSPGWVNLVLSNVAVVRNLPVPFHISFCKIRLVPSIVTMSTILSTSLFPKHYHSHAFWPNVARQLQELARQRDDPWESRFDRQGQQQETHSPVALSSSSQQSQLPRQPQKGLPPLDAKRTCACCCQPNPKMRCCGCNVLYYCDEVCQQGHWKLHKKTCGLQQQQQASSETATTTTSSSSFSSSQTAAASNKNHQQSKENVVVMGKKKWWNNKS